MNITDEQIDRVYRFSKAQDQVSDYSAPAISGALIKTAKSGELADDSIIMIGINLTGLAYKLNMTEGQLKSTFVEMSPGERLDLLTQFILESDEGVKRFNKSMWSGMSIWNDLINTFYGHDFADPADSLEIFSSHTGMTAEEMDDLRFQMEQARQGLLTFGDSSENVKTQILESGLASTIVELSQQMEYRMEQSRLDLNKKYGFGMEPVESDHDYTGYSKNQIGFIIDKLLDLPEGTTVASGALDGLNEDGSGSISALNK